MGNWTKLDSVQAELDDMYLLRRRHREWMEDTKDPEIRQTHREIIHLIEKMTDEFEILLKALNKPRNN